MSTKVEQTGTSRPKAKIRIERGSGKTHLLSYGTVTARVPVVKDKMVDRAEEGGRVLQRAGTKLMRPGIKLASSKGVPLYHADPDQPGVIIRRLDGRVERGIFQGREFQVKK